MLRPGFALGQGEGGENIMQRIAVLAGAMLTFGMLASPLRAQQSDQSAPAPAPAAPLPEAQQLPPPPPFPPMPSARHRWVDVGDRHSSRSHHKVSTSHHRATKTKHHGTKHAGKHKAHKAKPEHFSSRTIRQCHGMSYREIMHHSSCRALMSQELAAASAKGRHSKAHHKGAAHHKKGRRHKR